MKTAPWNLTRVVQHTARHSSIRDVVSIFRFGRIAGFPNEARSTSVSSCK